MQPMHYKFVNCLAFATSDVLRKFVNFKSDLWRLIISNILSTINNAQESLHLKKIFLFFGKSKLKARLKQAQSKIIPSSKSKIKASSKQAPSVP